MLDADFVEIAAVDKGLDDDCGDDEGEAAADDSRNDSDNWEEHFDKNRTRDFHNNWRLQQALIVMAAVRLIEQGAMAALEELALDACSNSKIDYCYFRCSNRMAMMMKNTNFPDRDGDSVHAENECASKIHRKMTMVAAAVVVAVADGDNDYHLLDGHFQIA